jgi:invasion protein IalB
MFRLDHRWHPQATPQEGIGFPLNLNGLGDGFDKLP